MTPQTRWSAAGLGGFVSHADGLSVTLDSVINAITDSPGQPVCVSGRPGIGKTALCNEILRLVSNDFDLVISLDCRDQSMDSTLLLDLLYAQLPFEVAAPERLGSARRSNPLSFLRGVRSLLYLDNADHLSEEILRMCLDNLAPSKVLVTTRDGSLFRQICPTMLEREHPGLTQDEMDELFSRLMDNDPMLLNKVLLAARDTRSAFVEHLSGWPQALILAAARLSTSNVRLADFVVAGREQDSLYERLLGELYTARSRTGRRVLDAGAAFPLTFTAGGLGALTGLRAPTLAAALQDAVNVRLVVESNEGVFRFAHPVVQAYAKARLRASVGGGEVTEAAGRYLVKYAEAHGGAATRDWANFYELDAEVGNYAPLIENMLAQRAFRQLTSLFRHIFPYLVERGYWVFTAGVCSRVVSEPRLPRSFRPDWCIWSSWLQYYLYDDPKASLRLAHEALAAEPRQPATQFEAHRRALLASGRLRRRSIANRHYAAAGASLSSDDIDRQADLLNTWGNALLGLSTRPIDLSAATEAFARARELLSGAGEINLREIGVATLGIGRAALLAGDEAEALRNATDGAKLARRISWHRGVAEFADLLADINERRGETNAAFLARSQATRVRNMLRLPNDQAST